MKKNCKIIIFFLIIFSIPLNGQSVNDKESFNLYVKLKQPYDVSTLLRKNSIKSFNVTLEKQELISNNIKGNVYKVVHQLSLKKLKELSALLDNNNEVYYTNLISKKTTSSSK
jgi:hypothetical protein